jgi:hypothetical protein
MPDGIRESGMNEAVGGSTVRSERRREFNNAIVWVVGAGATSVCTGYNGNTATVICAGFGA